MAAENHKESIQTVDKGAENGQEAPLITFDTKITELQRNNEALGNKSEGLSRQITEMQQVTENDKTPVQNKETPEKAVKNAIQEAEKTFGSEKVLEFLDLLGTIGQQGADPENIQKKAEKLLDPSTLGGEARKGVKNAVDALGGIMKGLAKEKQRLEKEQKERKNKPLSPSPLPPEQRGA